MAAGDLKTQYAASSNLTVTALNSLAASSTWVAGWQSDVIDNSTNKYGTYELKGLITAGATGAQVGIIEIWVIRMIDDTNWPDVFTGAGQAAKTVTSRNVLYSCGVLVKAIPTDAVASRAYPFNVPDIASYFGGAMPEKCLVWITHTAQSTTNTLAASGQQVTTKGIYGNVAQA
ncbi:MAG: hypothetical protein IPO08_21605 [Xanthomonadales bacterium]|nr:hypothetical protein [Xanthomonadales bacterium]